MIKIKKIIRLFSFLLIGLTTLTFTSCEKVIDVDLNDSEPQLVIEAQLMEGTQKFYVQISQTTSYFDEEQAIHINNAIVNLRDNEGMEVAIPFLSNGNYQAVIEAAAGKNYTLEVTIDERTYVASSYLPTKVELIDLETQFQEANAFLDEGYLIFSRFQDDPNITNYYRIIHLVDDVLQNTGDDFQVVDDNLFDGGLARVPLFQQIFNAGEAVTVVLRHMDKASYEYYNALTDIVTNEGGPNAGSAAPGNPTTNWSGGALGVFTAYASDTLSVVIPQ